MPRGTLYLIVGPSGAGKDALIDAVRQRLPASVFLFPRRWVTRPAGPGEDHQPISAETFEAQERDGAFALSWRAHGLAYGIGIEIASALDAGIHVIVNVSRTQIAAARAEYSPVRVIEITAPAHLRAERLKTRGREQEAAIDQRLVREVPFAPDATIVNDGPLETAIDALVAALQG
jgi:phosphonate metabolism protein PhnN/1,5-bisphosphokinase (PRPP-forming)